MERDYISVVDTLIREYNSLGDTIDLTVQEGDRASGGVQRALKGELVEHFARSLVQFAWRELGGNPEDLRVKKGSIKVPLQKSYLKDIKDVRVREHIEKHIKDYTYTFRIDVPVYIRDVLVMAIECKAYAENAMLKRILFDGSLIRKMEPEAEIVLFQLESQLGGDYSDIFKETIYGSTSTHTLMSYFDYPLHIITLLEGERKVDKPIHKKEFFKSMKKESVENALDFFKSSLRKKL